MKTIWKFPLEVTDVQQIEMPKGAEPISVQVQGGVLCIWAVVDTSRPSEKRTIRTIGTGQPMDEKVAQMKFLGAYQLQDGALVFHVFYYEG